MCRLVGVVCLSSGAMLNLAMGAFYGRGAAEKTSLRTLLDTLDRGDLVLEDACYGTYFLLVSLIGKGADAVFEQMGARVTDFRTGNRLSSKDHISELARPDSKPGCMTQARYDRARVFAGSRVRYSS